jgi:hypothetical protein
LAFTFLIVKYYFRHSGLKLESRGFDPILKTMFNQSSVACKQWRAAKNRYISHRTYYNFKKLGETVHKTSSESASTVMEK